MKLCMCKKGRRRYRAQDGDSFMRPGVTVMCFPPVEDGDALDPCILSTLRKLQDGYFAGARSVSAPQRPVTAALHSCSGAV